MTRATITSPQDHKLKSPTKCHYSILWPMPTAAHITWPVTFKTANSTSKMKEISVYIIAILVACLLCATPSNFKKTVSSCVDELDGLTRWRKKRLRLEKEARKIENQKMSHFLGLVNSFFFVFTNDERMIERTRIIIYISINHQPKPMK